MENILRFVLSISRLGQWNLRKTFLKFERKEVMTKRDSCKSSIKKRQSTLRRMPRGTFKMSDLSNLSQICCQQAGDSSYVLLRRKNNWYNPTNLNIKLSTKIHMSTSIIKIFFLRVSCLCGDYEVLSRNCWFCFKMDWEQVNHS